MRVTISPWVPLLRQAVSPTSPLLNLPADSDKISLYRLVLERGDFGIHNLLIKLDANSRPLVTSVYNWETGCILPAILSDPLMRVKFDLAEDKNGNPSITGTEEDTTPEDRVEHKGTFQGMLYVQVLSSSVFEQRSNCF